MKPNNFFKVTVIAMVMAIGSFSCNEKLENEYSLENEKSMLKSGVETEFYYTDSGTSSSPPQIASWTQAWDGSSQDRSISLNIVNGNTYYFVVTLW